ncbi:hypothetical protein SDC9_142890 [bioreactor metagenome]|uniref:Uncharacterized protein n=1 Tax=bioreactor metagenome TaxID=1076179 RepID=A0A645E2H8_9ZZZZ
MGVNDRDKNRQQQGQHRNSLPNDSGKGFCQQVLGGADRQGVHQIPFVGVQVAVVAHDQHDHHRGGADNQQQHKQADAQRVQRIVQPRPRAGDLQQAKQPPQQRKGHHAAAKRQHLPPGGAQLVFQQFA